MFTDAQRALITETHSTYVEACPGAGKTQAIVQRFIERPVSHPRKGVALISFTDAAIDECRQRCASSPDLLDVPNFIGTIDAFINRFLVGPTFLARKGLAPTFTDSWSSVPHTRIRAGGVPWQASLDWFEIDGRTAGLRLDRIPVEQRGAARRLEGDQQKLLEAAALTAWCRLVGRGQLSSAAARVAMRSYLGDDKRRDQLGSLMADRFSEIIVDEVQDCSADDLLVLQLIRDIDVSLVVVGDPDQSIYGFRSDTPPAIQQFLAALRPGERLNGNFRSSPAICKVVDSLRSSARSDRAAGPNQAVEAPIMLVPYKKRRDIPALVRQAVAVHDIDLADMVTLAHSGEHARAAAGAASTGASTSSRLVQLALAHYAVNEASSTAAERVSGMRTLERLILELRTDEVAELDRPDYLIACNLTDREFREGCLRIATALPGPFRGPPSAFRASLAAMSESQQRLSWTVKKLKTPNGDAWPTSPGSERSGSTATPLEHSTIHGLKGLQAPGVVLVLAESRADDDGVAQWVEGNAGEERRVLYVGASRAERLLVIAPHETIIDAVQCRLEADQVPFSRPTLAS